MDSDVSICIIPDTPSPSVLRGNTLPQENVDVVDKPSEESFRSNFVSDMNTYIEGLSPSLPPFATNSVDRFSDSPVFSCKRKLLDKKSEQDFGIHRHKLNTFSSDVNAPALPGSPEFAQERAKALKKKKVKNNLSPFTKSKYDLSPFKTGVNQLSACSPQKIMKNDLNSRWSPSPLEKEQICSKKKNEEYSGFVKSSSLLRKFGLNTNTSQVSAIPECLSPEKSKKRKVETASSRSAYDVVRPKVKKAKANYGWPSSSGSSDDESYVFSKCKKRKKKTVKSDHKGCAFKNQDMQLMNNATELDSNNTKLPKGKVGKKTRTSWTVTSTSENDESCNNIPVLKLKAVKQNEKKGIKCVGRKSVSGKVCPGPIDYLDSCDDEFLSSVVDYSLPGHENSVKSRKERKSTWPNAKIQSSPPSVGPNVSPKCLSPSSSDQTKSFCHGTLRNNYNILTSPTCSPALSSYLQFLDRSVTNNEQSTTSLAQRKSKSTKLRRNLHPSLVQVSPEQQRVDTQSNSSGSPLGSQANPIDLESATPETKKALEEIKQLQSDEEFARKMQEQLDLEFAMSLQNREESGGHGHGEIPQEASSHSEDASPSLNWHAYAPTRVRAGSARGIAAGNRRRARGGFLDEPWMQLLARESLMRDDLGSGNIQVDGWVRHPVSPGRRRRGGRRVVGLPIFSPNAEGGDYENLMNLAEMLGDAKEKGLSKSDLGRLPIVSYKKTGQEPEECNICMADYEIGDSQKILPCFHSFHSSCIDKWIKKNATCPICRVEVKV